ncbi:hypothetical protein ABZ260_22740 [Streptosporangium sp. NPDC006013]|uniref:DUF7927 domain-containing protein n=1 Tax=Streptosporangium sp. NPDC006013 TaxID=3155596 RepID=UPI0033AAEB77
MIGTDTRSRRVSERRADGFAAWGVALAMLATPLVVSAPPRNGTETPPPHPATVTSPHRSEAGERALSAPAEVEAAEVEEAGAGATRTVSPVPAESGGRSLPAPAEAAEAVEAGAGAIGTVSPVPAESGGRSLPAPAEAAEAEAEAGVEITKTASPVLARPGQKITYTVELRNTGDDDRPDFTFTDDLSGVLDDADFDHDESATSGTVSFAESRVTWSGDVAAGQTVTVSYGVTVNDPPAGDLRLSGELVGGEGSNCEAGSTDPACGNLDAPGLPLLYVLMTADRETVDPGEVVAYTVTVGNVGTAAYQGAALTGELSRVLDDAIYNGDARATDGTVSYGASKLAWAGDISAGETVTITYSVTVNTPDTGDRVLDSAVQARGGGTNCPGPAPEPARLGEPVPGASLGCAQRVVVEGVTIGRTLTPEEPGAGDTVTYTITVTNPGRIGYPGARLTDDLSGVLDDAVFGDVEASSGTVSYAEPVLDWQGDIPAESAVTITYRVTVGDPPPGDSMLRDEVVGVKPESNCSAGSTDPDCGTEPVRMAPAPAPEPAPASEAGPGPEPGAVTDHVPESAPVPGREQVSPPVSDLVPIPSPVRTSSPARIPSPARVPEPSSAPSYGPAWERPLPIPCPVGGPCAGPGRPALPFTGLPLGPVLAGFLLLGLGLAPRLCRRRGTP